MRKFSWILLSLALVTLLSGTMLAANEPVTVAKTDRVVVDGDLSDWGGIPGLYMSSKMSADATGISGDADNSAFFMLAYDANNLYIGIRVIDDIINTPRTDKLWEQDGFDMWIGPEQFGFTTVDGKPTIAQYWGFRGTEGTQIEMVPTAAGYVIEASFPISLVEQFLGKVESGAQFQTAFGTNDNDEGDTREGQCYFPNGWVWNELPKGATATFE